MSATADRNIVSYTYVSVIVLALLLSLAFISILVHERQITDLESESEQIQEQVTDLESRIEDIK